MSIIEEYINGIGVDIVLFKFEGILFKYENRKVGELLINVEKDGLIFFEEFKVICPYIGYRNKLKQSDTTEAESWKQMLRDNIRIIHQPISLDKFLKDHDENDVAKAMKEFESMIWKIVELHPNMY